MEDVEIQAAFSPYMAFGLFGNVDVDFRTQVTITDDQATSEGSSDVDFGPVTDDPGEGSYAPFANFGLRTGVNALLFQNFLVGVDYQYGLTDVGFYKDNGGVASNVAGSHRVINFNVGYMFGAE